MTTPMTGGFFGAASEVTGQEVHLECHMPKAVDWKCSGHGNAAEAPRYFRFAGWQVALTQRAICPATIRKVPVFRYGVTKGSKEGKR